MQNLHRKPQNLLSAMLIRTLVSDYMKHKYCDLFHIEVIVTDAGIKWETFRAWMRGEHTPNQENQKVLCDLFGIDDTTFVYADKVVKEAERVFLKLHKSKRDYQEKFRKEFLKEVSKLEIEIRRDGDKAALFYTGGKALKMMRSDLISDSFIK